MCTRVYLFKFNIFMYRYGWAEWWCTCTVCDDDDWSSTRNLLQSSVDAYNTTRIEYCINNFFRFIKNVLRHIIIRTRFKENWIIVQIKNKFHEELLSICMGNHCGDVY